MGPATDPTCWTVIRDAAGGDRRARDDFARRYEPAVRGFLGARWRGSPLMSDLDDATQEVFVDCFRAGGALERPDPARPFRAFLYGVTRNVARRVEEARAKAGLRLASEFDAPGREEALSAAFDAAWARSLVRQAAALQRTKAADDPAALRRVEILRLRFQEDVPIREIAVRLGEDPARVHHEYATAREEFRAALLEVVAAHHPGTTPGEIDGECRRLIACFP